MPTLGFTRPEAAAQGGNGTFQLTTLADSRTGNGEIEKSPIV